MKYLFVLVVLPMVFSIEPQKRLLIDTLFKGDELKTLLTQLSATLESDATEQACETECHTLIQQDHLLQFGCPLVCKSFQSLAHRFGIHSNSMTTKAPSKRLLIDTLFKGDELKNLLTQLSGTLESDATEQACEAECHTLIQQDHLLQFGCPLVCKSLQSLFHRFGIHPATTMASMPNKRLLIDTLFKGDELKTLLTQLSTTLESDATEQACETQCHTLIQADHLLQFGCPLVCKSFQSLVHRFGIHSNNMPMTTMPPMPNKRLLIDTLFKGDELKTLLTQLSSTLESDATEQACETECHTLIQQDHLLQFGCPLVCKSFQSLVHRFGIHSNNMQMTTMPPMPNKRLLIDTLFKGDELKTLLTQLSSTLESDATEQACETECHTLIQQDHLLQFGCPLVCKSFQSLVHRFGIHSNNMATTMASMPNKR